MQYKNTKCKISKDTQSKYQQENISYSNIVVLVNHQYLLSNLQLVKEFGDEQTKKLMADIQEIQKQIKQTKGVLAVWKEQGLAKHQIRALQILFARGNNKMKEICNILEQKKQLLESISQPEIQMIKALDQWTVMQKVKETYKNFEQFQNINAKAIDNLYSQIRVRQVHLKSKKSIKNNSQQAIISVPGINSKTDEEVEVTKIPKRMNDFDKVNIALVTFNAQRDLMLSPYFLRFLGYSTNSDPKYYYYFRQFVNSISIKTLLSNSQSPLQQHYPIFKYWAGEIFRGFRDIYYQCSYQPVLPITLSEIEVTDYGLRVLFKGVKFCASRQLQNNIEPQLLQNLGHIILELLRIQQSQIQTRIKSIEIRNLVYILLKARQGLKKYDDKIVPCKISFFNVQTHPLFESIQESQGSDIIDNFTILFNQFVL